MVLKLHCPVQVAPRMDETVSVVVHGRSFSPHTQESMEWIGEVIRRTVLDGMRDWMAANPDRNPGAPLPAVLLELQPPNLMLSLRTDT